MGDLIQGNFGEIQLFPGVDPTDPKAEPRLLKLGEDQIFETAVERELVLKTTDWGTESALSEDFKLALGAALRASELLSSDRRGEVAVKVSDILFHRQLEEIRGNRNWHS